MKKSTAIIIGAGIGGIATAIYLARQGIKVTILEKNSAPGGRCSQFTKDGHIFDTGPTFLLFPEIYRHIFESFGEKLEDHLHLYRVDPAQQICFDDNSKILCTNDKKLMQSQIEKFEPSSSANFNRLLVKAKIYHQLSMEHVIEKDFRHYYDFFNMKKSPVFL